MPIIRPVTISLLEIFPASTSCTAATVSKLNSKPVLILPIHHLAFSLYVELYLCLSHLSMDFLQNSYFCEFFTINGKMKFRKAAQSRLYQDFPLSKH